MAVILMVLAEQVGVFVVLAEEPSVARFQDHLILVHENALVYSVDKCKTSVS